ncbi:MAG: tetratricopeptide repeat protein [Alphaproteobacteria bacterium]|nr:tetratricopeptide repeat protein [Alphaproteobacteria bacterium]
MIRSFLVVLFLALLPLAAGAGQDDSRLPQLFDRLIETSDQGEADALAGEIWEIWYESPDKIISVMMLQGQQAMAIGDFEEAEEFFTAIIERDPKFAEGWNRRATLYYLMGRFNESIAAVEQTLALEPRHFGALSGMGLIFTALEDDAQALAWLERALVVNPHMTGIKLRVEDLREKLEGKPI